MDGVKVESHFYQAKWPGPLDPQLEPTWKKVARIAWDIFSVIVFPIGLARLALWALRQCAIKVLTPYLNNRGETTEWNQECGTTLLEDKKGHRVPLKTPTGVLLDAAFFPRSDEMAIIYFPGLYGKWQRGTQHGSDPHIEETGASVLMVNSRWHTHDNPFADEAGLALDGWTAFDYLIKRGFSPDQIVFMGHSMGGAVATLGAGLAQEAFPDAEIKLINWNSYHSFASTIKELISQRGQLPCGLEGVTCYLAYWVLRATGNVDVSSALEKIKTKVVIWNAADETIYSPAQAVQKATSGLSFEMKSYGKSADHPSLEKRAGWAHIRPFTPSEGRALQAILLRFFGRPLSDKQAKSFGRYVTVI
ncbi:MAG: hypothetical protein K940chlam2_00242 [Chlamydiae bacterium]|nr:hypothetical protein [Chlamydiota bacterium]